MTLSPDTTVESFRILTQMYQKMTPQEKLQRIFSAYETGKALAMAGLRRLHPDTPDDQIWHMWARQHLGEQLHRQVYGDSLHE